MTENARNLVENSKRWEKMPPDWSEKYENSIKMGKIIEKSPKIGLNNRLKS